MKQKIAAILAAFGLAAGMVLVSSGPAAASPVCPNSIWLPGKYTGQFINIPADANYNTYCHLQRGAGGTGVKALQQSIYWCYYVRPNGAWGSVFNIARDGSYGPKTEAAVRAVQSFHSISADGVYGPQTRNTMLHFGQFEAGDPDTCDYFKA
ncbi:peptidoglycan-binding domain-containing protein [Streptomyces sp. NPDC005408]|uniref:peptidoglycan-binding domain-containing protein n=1 Tax=Streptomyces sp. NPDC005408 TaxID=3155341 RepID=UPI0033AB4E51